MRMRENQVQLLDDKLAFGAAGAAAGFSIEMMDKYLGTIAASIGILVSLATLAYVCLGIYMRWRRIKAEEDGSDV